MATVQNGTYSSTLIDIEKVEAKIREERDKRKNEKGSHQFREATGELAKFAIDPWAKDDGRRPPVNETVDVLIVGCGFGGVLAAKKLHDAGIHNIRMVDKASDFGGVWYWNRYPGLYCDTEAYIYLPLLEETGHIPSAKYTPGYEIQEHIVRIATKEDLRPRALFQTEVNDISWDGDQNTWTGRTNRGDTIKARFVILTIGILHKLHLPGIPGIEDFEGHSFHSARWDYAYTGGDIYGAPLDKLNGKRVALVGTGASTIQTLPKLATSGAEVYVFQRTPSSVDRRDNVPTDKEWFASLQPGWQEERCLNFDAIINGSNPQLDMIDDGWTKHVFCLHSLDTTEPFESRLKKADYDKMAEIRARVESIVKDKATAEGLKAWYTRSCKRPCFNDEYLQSFNRPNVYLVNTDGKGVQEVTKTGIVAAGVEYEMDCIIYATGFDWSNDYSERANMRITGRNGLTLSKKWVRGPSTFQGMLSRDFPNLLLFTHLQSSTSPNYTHLLSERAKQAAYIISESIKHNKRSVEPTQQAEDAWVKKLENIAIKYLDHFRQCTPGYLNQEGEISESNLRNASVGLSTGEWAAITAEWRKNGKFEGLEFDRE